MKSLQNYQVMNFVEENDPDSSIGKVQKAYDADTEENQQNYYFLVCKLIFQLLMTSIILLCDEVC